MHKPTLGAGAFILSLALCSAPLTYAGQSQNPNADNTKINQRDRSKSEPTADQQNNRTSDRELTAKIRRAIVEDKSLSTYAHNVKIITQHGEVTLKGAVHSEDESRAVEAKAKEAAGGANVKNELTVKGDSAKRSKSAS